MNEIQQSSASVSTVVFFRRQKRFDIRSLLSVFLTDASVKGASQSQEAKLLRLVSNQTKQNKQTIVIDHAKKRGEVSESRKKAFVSLFPLLFLSSERDKREIAIWLILPVVIRLSQRLSHACLSINDLYCETAYGSLNQL